MASDARCAGARVIGLTALGVGLALVDPALAGSTRPHPTLTGSLGDAAGILQNNARVLAAPFLLVVLDFPQTASVAVPATSSSPPSPPRAPFRSGSSWDAGKADCCHTCRSCHSNGRRSPSLSMSGSRPLRPRPDASAHGPRAGSRWRC